MTSSWIKQRLFPRKLEDYKYLICHEQAPVASYVLHKLGIPNDLCYGVGYVTNKSSDNSAALHCFVQCESTNIVDATDKAHPFCRCLNGAKISRGEIAITDNGNKAITVETYGGGRASFGNMIAIVFTGFKSNHLFATRDKMLLSMTGKDYTGIVTPTKYTSQEIHKADANRDGLLSKVEINALHNLKTQGAISVKAAELPKLAVNSLSRRE